MASDVDICSLALNHLGAKGVTAINPPDGTPESILCGRRYPIARDVVLRSYPWNFAIIRTSLAKLSGTPVFGFGFQYQIPQDPLCLRVLETSSEEIPWHIEGRTLVTDASSISIVYIAQIIDTNIFDPLFVDALIFRLASDMALSVTGEPSTARQLFELYKVALGEARTMDSHEGSQIDFDIPDVLAVR